MRRKNLLKSIKLNEERNVSRVIKVGIQPKILRPLIPRTYARKKKEKEKK